MVNIINGGKHAGGDLRIQEFMIVPAAERTGKENLRISQQARERMAIRIARQQV